MLEGTSSTGCYGYDGAGNVEKIGNSYFVYDKVSRLVDGHIHTGPGGGGGGTQVYQTYAFDPYGNITSINTNGVTRNTPTSLSTNRLTSAAYDGAGNVTGYNGAIYQYGPFNEMWRYKNGAEEAIYLYTADGERLWEFNLTPGKNINRWTLRDLEGKVLREYEYDRVIGWPNGWTVERDYVYRAGTLLAAQTSQGVRHFSVDHLGTPRLITNQFGNQVAYHAYYPFGEEATVFNQDSERMKFTGHERDLHSAGGAGDDLDYMHARFCSPITGRFLGVDPANSAMLPVPQTWNKYAYTRGNPLRYIDPDGRQTEDATGLSTPWSLGALLKSAQAGHVFLIDSEEAEKLQQTTEALNRSIAAAEAIATIARSALPADTRRALGEIESGKDRPNVRNPDAYRNDGSDGAQILPTHDAQGEPITYTRHNVNPKDPEKGHDDRRIVVGSDGKYYFTDEHYRSFKLIQATEENSPPSSTVHGSVFGRAMRCFRGALGGKGVNYCG